MRIKFITFGSHDNYIEAAERIIKQANDLHIFSETVLYTPEYLQNDSDFWNNHGEFITKNARGYGYWLWKPFIIKKAMEDMSDGDILFYLDCGCEFSSEITMKNNLLRCIDIVKTDKIVGSHTCLEREYNKMDLIEKLDMNKPEYLNTDQRQGGTNLFLICDDTRKLVNEWYELASDYHNIDDTPSIATNLDCFVEHRHDQSIFSLLTKKYKLFSNHLLEGAIYMWRNKTGVSRIRS